MAVPRNQCATLSVSFTARVDAQLNQKRNNEAGLPGPWPTREQDLTATRWRVESLQGQTGQQPGTCPWAGPDRAHLGRPDDGPDHAVSCRPVDHWFAGRTYGSDLGLRVPTAPIRGCNPTVPALLLATSSLRRGRPRTTSQGPKLRSVRPRATPRSVHEACAGRPSPGLACDGRPVFESFDRCRGSRLVPRTTRSVRGRGFGQSMDQDRALSDPSNLVGSQRISLDPVKAWTRRPSPPLRSQRRRAGWLPTSLPQACLDQREAPRPTTRTGSAWDEGGSAWSGAARPSPNDSNERLGRVDSVRSGALRCGRTGLAAE